MGWYDAFKGDTARVNLSSATGGSAAKNFGDAFSSIGNTMINSELADGKTKLMELQLQNEQNKMDETANNRADKNTQQYASTMTRDAWGKDKDASLQSLDTTASPEATLNAQQAIKEFYTPTKEMKQEWTGQEKATQDANDKSYLNDAFKLDPTASKDSRQNAVDALTQFYHPEAQQVKELEDRFKGQDLIAQTKFNDELREKATSFKTFKELQASDGYKTLLTNADAATVEHVIDRFNLSDKDAAALRKTNAEINHYANADSVAQQELDVKRAKENREAWEFKHPQAKVATGSDKAEAETKVLKSVNDMVVTQYGKTDSKGFTAIDPSKGEEAKWVHTRAISNIANYNMSPADAFTKAQISFTERSKKVANAADPLGLKQ